MSKCVNPSLFRLFLNKNWINFWHSDKKNFAKNVIEDIKIKFYIRKILNKFLITKIFINKSNFSYNFTIYLKKKSITKFYKDQYKILLNKLQNFLNNKNINLSVKPEKNVLWNPISIFYKISDKIKKRKNYKNIFKSMLKESIKIGFGYKVRIKGRINGSIMSKIQIYKYGKLPLSTLNSNIRYYQDYCKTNYGIIGIKIWIYLGNYSYKYVNA